MGRPKKYDRTDLLDRSVEVFRQHGYSGTTTAQLAEELGVNRKSMYAEFGSKQGLFQATLEHYSANHLTRVLAPIEAPNADIEAIRQAFAGYASATEGWFYGRGCLMCNTAVERGALDPASGQYVADYLARITKAFGRALENGQRAGDLSMSANVDELAAFLTTALIGVAASIRAEAPPDQVQAACRVATTVLDLHRPDRPD